MRQFCDPIATIEYYYIDIPAIPLEIVEAAVQQEKWRTFHSIPKVPPSPVRRIVAHSSGGSPG